MSNDIKSIRKQMGMDIASMAKLMNMPYRTYQDKELGNRPVKPADLQLAHQLLAVDREFMTNLTKKLTEDIGRRFPDGIKFT